MDKQKFYAFTIFGLVITVCVLFYISMNQQMQLEIQEEDDLRLARMMFELQTGTMNELCEIHKDVDEANLGLIDAQNNYSKCKMDITIAGKMYNYRTYGLEPTFTDAETEYLKKFVDQRMMPNIDDEPTEELLDLQEFDLP